ncbi:MAG TPA: ATP-binding protein [Vicinamibacterales bacterium]|nr:ATP-binding protein [Vicinamibacterales bacterium]
MRRPRRRSVRRQLLVLLLAAVSLAWIAAAAVSFRDARHEVAEVLDAHLAQTASLISVQRDGHEEDDEVDTEHAPVLHRYGRRVMFQVWKDGTSLGLHSQHAPDRPLSSVTDGFSDATIGGSSWRVFSTWDARRRVLVQVAEQDRERGELATAVARNFIVPLAVTLPVLGVVIWAAIGRATQSLTHVNRQVAAREADNLTPLDVADAPSEIGALVTNLNHLFARVQGMIEQERRFTADAAHELRTPLAGIRAQAQVARGATSDVERTHALDGVMAGCDRAAHVVEQMLTLARLAPDAVSFQPAAVQLTGVLTAAVADLAPAALLKRIDVAFRAPRPAVVLGDDGLLGVLFRNLVDNAIRYSAPGTKVDIDLDVPPGGTEARVRVRDGGPGMSAEERERAGRRFHRPAGTKPPGSGLGLSIVQRIVDLHRGTLRLAPPAAGAGLEVTVSLPRVLDEPPVMTERTEPAPARRKIPR